MLQLKSSRLRLRLPTAADLEDITAMNADADVMHHFPAPYTADESHTFLQNIVAHQQQHGFGVWLIECPIAHQFIGMCGLKLIDFSLNNVPANSVEIMWRLQRSAWGNMVATEAASIVLNHAFAELALPEVYAFTATTNRRSEAVMQRLSMRALDGFVHPKLPANHHLAEHVLYKITAHDWANRPSTPYNQPLTQENGP